MVRSPPAVLAAFLLAFVAAEQSAPALTQTYDADPTCAKGLLNSDSTVCCPKSCTRCGGSSCQNLPGGRDSCCSSSIKTEGRRCTECDAPCVMPPPAPTPPPPPTPPAKTVNPKRGFVADDAGVFGSCDTPLLLNTSGWYYDYNEANPYRKVGLKGNCAVANVTDRHRFVGMNWCLSGVEKPIPDDVDKTYWMGFNEPNNLHNCNTDAATVAKAWGRVMELHPAPTQLVSPATAGNGVQFYEDFFGNCTQLYGAPGCRISYLATHCYSCTPASTLLYLKRLHDLFGYKVWLTEFSCGDHAEGKSTAEHLKFMREVLPLLDQADYVYRYSWMAAQDSSGLRGLIEKGEDNNTQLTELGHVWNGP